MTKKASPIPLCCHMGVFIVKLLKESTQRQELNLRPLFFPSQENSLTECIVPNDLVINV
jgi:hypothetical protein